MTNDKCDTPRLSRRGFLSGIVFSANLVGLAVHPAGVAGGFAILATPLDDLRTRIAFELSETVLTEALPLGSLP